MFLSINHACDISSIMDANVILMEYPSFGIYEYPNIEMDIKPTTPQKGGNHRSVPLKEDPLKLLKRSICPNGIVKQIYSDLKSVLRFLENNDEIMNKKVLIYGKGMGAHFALYAATQLKFKLGGLILQN
mmetsp:Transcript_16654/g.14560  ORF Transcript_16654/g.14560 Transcript_16654/m.14560 type:complete len:129 (-) Transcript_16654:654-1040(-)